MYLQLSLLPSRFFLVSLKFQFLVMHQKENSSLGVSIQLASKFTSTRYIHVPVNMHVCLQAECLVEELERYNLGDLINIRSNLPSQIYVDIRSPTIYISISVFIGDATTVLCGHPSHTKVQPFVGQPGFSLSAGNWLKNRLL